jgi:hypothetical protein
MRQEMRRLGDLVHALLHQQPAGSHVPTYCTSPPGHDNGEGRRHGTFNKGEHGSGAERKRGQVPEVPGAGLLGGRVEPKQSTFGADNYENEIVASTSSPPPSVVTVSANPRDTVFDLQVTRRARMGGDATLAATRAPANNYNSQDSRPLRKAQLVPPTAVDWCRNQEEGEFPSAPRGDGVSQGGAELPSPRSCPPQSDVSRSIEVDIVYSSLEQDLLPPYNSTEPAGTLRETVAHVDRSAQPAREHPCHIPEFYGTNGTN